MKKIYFFFSFFLLTTISFSQVDSLPTPEAYFSAIIVSDIDQSIDWYVKNLGFDVLNENRNEAMGYKQANLNCGDILIELIELKQILKPEEILKNETKGTKIGGFFKFGIKVDRFDKWMEHLINNKVEIHGRVVTDPISEKRMVILKDPDGNRIQLFEK